MFNDGFALVSKSESASPSLQPDIRQPVEIALFSAWIFMELSIIDGLKELSYFLQLHA